ncbi:unnamed protein product [Sphagnum balticum]
MQLFCLGRLFLELVFSIQNWADDYNTSTIPSFGTEKPIFLVVPTCVFMMAFSHVFIATADCRAGTSK